MGMTMNDLERCARAAYNVEWADHGSESDFEDSKDYWLQSARAVLSALIPPSEGMKEAGLHAIMDLVAGESEAAFTAMIQHVIQ